MNMIIITIIALLTAIIFAWIFSLDIHTTTILIIIILIIMFTISYFTIPEISIKTRIVNATNYNQTLKEVKNTLSQEEYEYYRLAILINSKKDIYNHTVNYIIKLGKDASETKISDYLY